MLVIQTSTGTRLLSAGSALLDILDQVSQVLTGDPLDPENAGESLEQLLLFLKNESGIDEPFLEALLQNLIDDPDAGVSGALRETAWFAAKNRLAKLQGDQQWLVRAADGAVDFLTLGDVDQNDPIALDWQQGANTDVPVGELVFAASANASAALKFEVTGNAQRAQKSFGINLADQANSRLAIFSVEGGLGVNVTKGGSGAQSISFAGGFEASGAMRYIYQEPANVETLSMFVYAMKTVPNPFDIDDIADELAPPGVAGLRQIRFDRASSGHLNLGLNFARAVSTPTVVSNVPGGATLPLNKNLDITVKLGFRAEGARGIVVERGANDTLVLSSTYRRSANRSLGLDLGASVELQGFDKVAAQWAGDLIPEVGDKLTEQLQEYAQPGKILTDKIGAALDGGQDWVSKLGELLLGDTTADALTAEIKTRIQEALDTRVDLFDEIPNTVDEAASRAEALAAKLAARLAENEILALFAEDLADWIKDAVQSPLNELAEEFRQKIETAVDEDIADGGAEAAARALQPLADFGLRLSALEDDMDAFGQEVLGPVFKFLHRYAEQRSKLLGAVEKAAKARLALQMSLSSTTQSSLTRDWVTRLKIPAGGFPSGARSDYRRWLAGRLPVEADFGDTRIGQPEGSIVSQVGNTTTANLTFDLGALSFNYQSIIKANAEFKVGLDGTITAAVAGFSGNEMALGGKRSTTAAFSGLIPIVSSEGVRNEPFSVTYSLVSSDTDADDRADHIEAVLSSITTLDSDGVFSVMRGREADEYREAIDAEGEHPTRVRLTAVVPSANFTTMIRDGLDERRLGRLLWRMYSAKNDGFEILRNMESLPSGELDAGDVMIAVANFKEHRQGRGWMRDLGQEIGLRDSGSAPSNPVIRDAHDARKAFEGIKIFFGACGELVRSQPSSAPAGATADEMEAFAKGASQDAFELAKSAADGLKFAVDASETAFPSDGVPRDLLVLLAYLDASLLMSSRVAALNLETLSGQTWSLISA